MLPLVAVDCLILQICYADNSVKHFCLVPCILCIHLRQLAVPHVGSFLCYLNVSVSLSVFASMYLYLYLYPCVRCAVKCDSNHTTHTQIFSRFHSLSFTAFHSALQNYFLRISVVENVVRRGRGRRRERGAGPGPEAGAGPAWPRGIHQFHLLLTPKMRTMLTKRYEQRAKRTFLHGLPELLGWILLGEDLWLMLARMAAKHLL